MRNRFPFFNLNPDTLYLDSAATSQTLDTVIQDSNNFLLNHKANAHRSGHSMGAWVDERYHTAKSKIGKWLGIDNPHNRIVFNSGASQGLYDSVQLIKQKYKDVSVYVGIDSHHSLLLSLRDISSNIKYINIKDGLLDLETLEHNLQKDKSLTKVIAINAVGNVLGVKQDLDKIRNLCKEYNTISIIDACQSMGKIEHNYTGFDFVAWSWHKIYGPMGLGCLLIDEKWLDCNPVHPGGGSVTHVGMHESSFLDNATRFESGTQNLQGIVTLPRLLDFLIEMQSNIIAHDKVIAAHANELCKDAVCKSDTGLISFTVPFAVEDFTMLLDANNICVRGGNLCAEPLVSNIKQGNVIRLSWAAYTTKQEIEYAFEKIGEVYERISRFT